MRPITQAENLMASLGGTPDWLVDFAAFAVQRHCVSRACLMVSGVGRLARDGGPRHPQALLERTRRPGRSPGALARMLEEFFVERHLAFGLDEAARLSLGRRERRVAGVPEHLRPPVAAFAEHLVRAQLRARHAGTRARSDGTIESLLALVRDFACFLDTSSTKDDWSVVDVGDVEIFLALQSGNRHRRLGALRQFFRFARSRKLVLVDPTRGIPVPKRGGFRGTTLSLTEQRRLFKRWTGDDVHPHEALVGLLALLHAASSAELRGLCMSDVASQQGSIKLGNRPQPVPLDPPSIDALRRALQHREDLRTLNPHVIVTGITRTRTTPASEPYLTHVLDAAATSTKRLRSTRLVALVGSLDPRIVGGALGMNAEGLINYVTDDVDTARI